MTQTNHCKPANYLLAVNMAHGDHNSDSVNNVRKEQLLLDSDKTDKASGAEIDKFTT